MMTNGDRMGRIFLSNPHTDNGFFFMLATYEICIFASLDDINTIFIPKS